MFCTAIKKRKLERRIVARRTIRESTAIKEDKNIANKLNHSFTSIFAQYIGRY